MKNVTTGSTSPTNLTDWERVRTMQDEDIVQDDDCPYNPDDEAAVRAFWKDAIVCHSNAEMKEKLAQRRSGNSGVGSDGGSPSHDGEDAIAPEKRR